MARLIRAGGPRGRSTPPARAALVRSLRFLQHLRGWRRLALALCGRKGHFVVSDGETRFEGDLASHIDREVYLFGAYEADNICLFLDSVDRRGVALDIGANVGNHSILFARAFDRVHAFEPNPGLWAKLERNIALNHLHNIMVHRIGAADKQGSFPLFDVDGDNQGLATFLNVEQYERPLRQIGTARTEALDDYLADERIDAVKIDVQGWEPQVLKGMRRILERDRPVVWTEVGDGTLGQTPGRAALEALFPYTIVLKRFETTVGALARRAMLSYYTKTELEPGDYIVFPADPE